jgi:hypothetical protein
MLAAGSVQRCRKAGGRSIPIGPGPAKPPALGLHYSRKAVRMVPYHAETVVVADNELLAEATLNN